MAEKEIKEIRIREVDKLSCKAQNEVFEKLKEKSEEFDFQGYAKVFYAETSPLEAIKVEPIEGDIIDELQRLDELMKK